MVVGKRVKDRRIEKTQRLLREALVSLIHEKNYDTIVVKEILHRANVGRSTFYTHFRDKDELLVSGIHEIIHSAESQRQRPLTKPYEKIIWFSRPIFEYLNDHRVRGLARRPTTGRAIHEQLQRVLAELISNDVTKGFGGRRKIAPQVPPGLLVEYVVSTFILVLNWWVESKEPHPVNDAEELFRGLVLPTLAQMWE
jgi:AcrR family transcriptional regulator